MTLPACARSAHDVSDRPDDHDAGVLTGLEGIGLDSRGRPHSCRIGSVPIRLPTICVPLTELPVSSIPAVRLPEMTLPALVAPITFADAAADEHSDVVSQRKLPRGIGADLVAEQDVARRAGSV